MIDRMMRAIRLDRTLFRQVADNPEYTSEAVLIAVIVSVIASLGALFGGKNALLLFIGQLANQILLGWILWALVAYFVGTALFKGRSQPMEMIRTLAYAGVPRVLGIFGAIPCVGWIFALAGWVLSVVAGVIAIRESMEFDTTSAVVTALVGFILFVIASVIIGLILAPITALGGL
jgi:hypothetical protein